MLPIWIALPALALELTPSAKANLGASYWFDGVQAEASGTLTAPFWKGREGALFGDSGLSLSATTKVSPSYVRVGPELKLAPLAIFNLTAYYTPSYFFGTFTSLVGFPDADANHTKDELKAATLRGERRSGVEQSYGGTATVQAKAGPVVVAVVGEVTRYDLRVPELVGDYYFEPEATVLVATRDTTWGTTAVLAWQGEGDHKPLVGLLNSQIQSVATGDENIKLGPLCSWSSGSLSYVVLAQAHLRDRDFEGVFPPYVAGQVTWRWEGAPWGG